VNGLRTNRYNIGIDIGGTKVNIGIIKETGEIVDKVKISSKNSKKVKSFVNEIVNRLKKLLESNKLNLEEVCFIGVGVPGTVDIEKGIVEYCPNLFWEMVPLVKYFSERLPQKEIKIIQDSWAAALAEHEFGAGRGYAHMACVTLGTGIGGGVILNNKIFQGGLHCAGEIGHIIVQKDGRKCNCGNSGCLEKYSSGNGIFEQAIEQFPEEFEGRTLQAETVFQMAYEGNRSALDLIDNSVQMLAIGIANMVDILSLEAVVISGGLCIHEELVVNPLKKYVKSYGYYSWTRQERFVIHCAELVSDAPMLGAAFIYKGLQ